MIRYAVCVDVSLNNRKIQGVYIEKYKTLVDRIRKYIA